MTPYEKTRIYSDYLDALPTKTPQEVKDTIVKLASIMFEAADQTVAPAIAAADPTKLAEYLGIDQLLDQAVSDPSDESIQYIKDTVDDKLDRLAGTNQSASDVGLKASVDSLFRELVKAKIDKNAVNAGKKEVEDKLATIQAANPNVDTASVMRNLEKAITYAMAGNLADFQSRRNMVDKLVNELNSSHDSTNAIDANAAIDYLTNALAERGLNTYTGNTNRELSGVQETQVTPYVVKLADLINNKIARDQEFNSASDELMQVITETANAIKERHPEADSEGLLGMLSQAVDMVKNYQGNSDEYKSIKKSVDPLATNLDAKRDSQNNVNIGVDYGNITANLDKAINTDPNSPEYQSVYDALINEVSTLEQKVDALHPNVPSKLVSYTKKVVEQGQQKDPNYDNSRKFLNTQLSNGFVEVVNHEKSNLGSDDEPGAVKPLVAQLFELLDAKTTNDISVLKSIDDGIDAVTMRTEDETLIDIMNDKIYKLFRDRQFGDEIVQLLDKAKARAEIDDQPKLAQIQDLSSKLTSAKASNSLGDQIKSAFAKLYNLGNQQTDTATRATETVNERSKTDQVSRILGIDELFDQLGKVPADALEAKLHERLEELKNTIPVDQIDISSVAEKVESAKQDFNVKIVQANEAANKARDEYNTAVRTLDENNPADWDKLHELQQNARGMAKEVKALRNKLDTLTKVFDFAEFNREISEQKTTQQSLALNTKEDDLRKQREEYYAAQHQSDKKAEEDDGTGGVAASTAPKYDIEAVVKGVYETLTRMIANKGVRAGYNDMIASIKKANAERKQLRSADPSADVKSVLAASFSEGTLGTGKAWSTYQINGNPQLGFPVFPFSELFGTNPKAVINYSEEGNIIYIKERELTMSDGSKRPGSWEIQISAYGDMIYGDVSIPNDPKNPAAGYDVNNAVEKDISTLMTRGGKPAFLADVFSALAALNPRMQI